MAGHRLPQDVAAAAHRALDWIDQGHQGSGFTETGHQHDAEATGFQRGDDGYPSPGRVAWDAWGGDAGRRWAGQKQFEDL